MSINTVTLVSDGLLSLAEQKAAMSEKISTNMVEKLTSWLHHQSPLICALKLKFDHDMKYFD